jgi:cyclase
VRRIGPNSFAEFYFLGCNPGFVATEDGVLMIDTPQRGIDGARFRELVQESGPIRYIVNTEAHADHTWGNSFFRDVEVVGSHALRREFENTWAGFGGPDGRLRRTMTSDPWLGDPESVWLMDQPDFGPHPPATLFEDELTLTIGHHEVHCLRMPGHTLGQTSVHIPKEGLVFTGDTVFWHCRTWLHDADPWAWLASLDRLRALDAETIIPGHGEPCSKDYLAVQTEVIENWLGLVEGFVDAGMTGDEAARQPVDVRADLDPYPMGQRLWQLEEVVTDLNIRNLHRRIVERRAEKGARGQVL